MGNNLEDHFHITEKIVQHTYENEGQGETHAMDLGQTLRQYIQAAELIEKTICDPYRKKTRGKDKEAVSRLIVNLIVWVICDAYKEQGLLASYKGGHTLKQKFVDFLGLSG